jgi:hypothetical protein
MQCLEAELQRRTSSGQYADLVRWMLIFWVGQDTVIAGILFAFGR